MRAVPLQTTEHLAAEHLAGAQEATASLRRVEALLVGLATDGFTNRPTEVRRTRASGLVTWIGRATLGVGVVVAVVLVGLILAPRVLPVQTLVVVSGSMEPAIPTGSLILMERVDSASLGVGEIITFQRPDRVGELITHRIVAEQIASDGTRAFATKGDASGVPDPWVVPAVGIGWRALGVVPVAGYLLEALRSDLARLLLFIGPLSMLAAIALQHIWRRARD